MSSSIVANVLCRGQSSTVTKPATECQNSRSLLSPSRSRNGNDMRYAAKTRLQCCPVRLLGLLVPLSTLSTYAGTLLQTTESAKLANCTSRPSQPNELLNATVFDQHYPMAMCKKLPIDVQSRSPPCSLKPQSKLVRSRVRLMVQNSLALLLTASSQRWAFAGRLGCNALSSPNMSVHDNRTSASPATTVAASRNAPH